MSVNNGRRELKEDHKSVLNRERQRRFQAKRDAERDQLEELKEALTRACERGRSTRLSNRLPDDQGEWVPELIERLNNCRLIACKKEKE